MKFLFKYTKAVGKNYEVKPKKKNDLEVVFRNPIKIVARY
jgi:hypothetical protein